MYTRSFTYKDWNDVERTEEFRFNLTKAELMEMQYEQEGGMREYLDKIIKSNNQKELMRLFKDLVLKAYGEKSEDGKYFVKNKTTGKALLNYWVELSAYRSDAFKAFLGDILTLRPQFKEYISTWQKNNGQDAIKKLRADVKEHYRDKYSQLNMDNEELLSRGNEDVAELMEKELRYVETIEG